MFQVALRPLECTTEAARLMRLEFSGARNSDDMHIVRSAARAQGLDVTPEGTIISPFVELPQLVGTIALVANASKEAAHSLIAKSRVCQRETSGKRSQA